MRSKRLNGDKIFVICLYLFLSFMLIIVLYPLIYIVSASFSDPTEVVAGNVWLFPKKPTLMAYKAVFAYKQIWVGYGNSLLYMVTGTVINVFMTVLAAYPLSRKDLIGRNAIMGLFVFTMFFGGGLIPTYLLVRNLGMIDTRWAMIIPNALAVWNVIIARTFFQTTIPVQLLEASKIDGCTDMKFVLKVVLPLSKPILAVLALFYAIGHWNSYFNALIYLNDSELFPLQIILRNIMIKNQNTSGMMMNIQNRLMRERLAQILKYALIVCASAPVLIIYPMVQKHFIKGVMIGSIKE